MCTAIEEESFLGFWFPFLKKKLRIYFVIILIPRLNEIDHFGFAFPVIPSYFDRSQIFFSDPSATVKLLYDDSVNIGDVGFITKAGVEWGKCLFPS